MAILLIAFLLSQLMQMTVFWAMLCLSVTDLKEKKENQIHVVVCQVQRCCGLAAELAGSVQGRCFCMAVAAVSHACSAGGRLCCAELTSASSPGSSVLSGVNNTWERWPQASQLTSTIPK